MSKITTEHLARSAYVYIRQSTADQLTHDHESRRRQYGLANRARQLGWTKVEVVDDDLGRSGGGIARPGFERWPGCLNHHRLDDEGRVLVAAEPEVGHRPGSTATIIK